MDKERYQTQTAENITSLVSSTYSQAFFVNRIFITSLVLMSFASEVFAFQQCPAGTRPCASLFEVLALVVLPSLVVFFTAKLAKKKIQRVWLKRSTIAALAIAWLFWLLIIMGALNAFLAQCSGSCWYSFLS